MKILYAASERKSALIQAYRFVKAAPSHIIKIAAYNTYNPGLYIDWNLESLKDIFNQQINFNSLKLESFFNQVKHFDPDIIISDIEPYSSYIANALNKPIWQVSPNLLYKATHRKQKINMGLYKKYPDIFSYAKTAINGLVINNNNIFNSNRNLIYSHFCDTDIISPIENFEWVRPYHSVGKISAACKHNIVSCILKNNKKFIDYLKQYDDSVAFSTFTEEAYPKVQLKNIQNLEEYDCNIKNCNVFVGQGHNDFIADAFYNNKPYIIIPDLTQKECIINAAYSKQFNLGEVSFYEDIESIPKIEPIYNHHVKYLHEYLAEI